MASEQESTIPPPLPDVRRVITGHTLDGKSTVLRDTLQTPFQFKNGNSFYDIHRTNETPAIIDSEVSSGEWVDEIAKDKGLVSPNGSVVRVTDLAPGSVAPFHRTVSVDYAIVVKGSIVLELDDGKRVTLNEGDTLVQRGTIHTWRNESDNWTRLFFVLLDAREIEIKGEKLKEEFRGPPSKS